MLRRAFLQAPPHAEEGQLVRNHGLVSPHEYGGFLVHIVALPNEPLLKQLGLQPA